MGYVDKQIALRYLANSEVIFNKVRLSFLESYKNAVAELNEKYQGEDMDELYRYIHSIKGISLNLGSQVLYDDAVLALEEIKKGALSAQTLDKFIYTLRNVYDELSRM